MKKLWVSYGDKEVIVNMDEQAPLGVSDENNDEASDQVNF